MVFAHGQLLTSLPDMYKHSLVVRKTGHHQIGLCD